MIQFSTLDIIAFVWFIFGWLGYTYFASHCMKSAKRLRNSLQGHISDWVYVIQNRPLRIVDISIAANLERNATFMASSSLLVIAGLLTLIGSAESTLSFFTGLTFMPYFEHQSLELKVIFLIMIFVYAFFTYSWCLRQWGIASILIGSAPMQDDEQVTTEERVCHAKSLSKIIQRAVVTFNLGLRAFYFSIAWMTWFIHPVAFIVSTTWVVAVLYRREFHSRTLKALNMGTNWSKSYRDNI